MLAALAQAKVLVYVGAGREPWLEEIIRALPGRGRPWWRATQGLALITEILEHSRQAPPQEQHQSAQGHSHGPGAGNPLMSGWIP